MGKNCITPENLWKKTFSCPNGHGTSTTKTKTTTTTTSTTGGGSSSSSSTVIPRLTSDPANEFFGKRRFFSLFFGIG